MTKQQRAIMTLVAAVVVYFLFFRKAKAAAAAPSVPGTVTSGSASAQIETNVLNDNFGLVVDPATDVTDPGDVVATGSETP